MKSSDLLSESDASGAVNTSVHVGDDQWSDVFILDCSFEFIVPAMTVSVKVRVILEITLSSLVTDWAVKRMIC